MVREDTAITGVEQDQLPAAGPWNDLSAFHRVDHHEEKSRRPCWPAAGQRLDNTDNFNDNFTCSLVPFSGQLPQNCSETRERLQNFASAIGSAVFCHNLTILAKTSGG